MIASDLPPVLRIHRRHTARLMDGLERARSLKEAIDWARYVMAYERNDLLVELAREKEVAPDEDKN